MPGGKRFKDVNALSLDQSESAEKRESAMLAQRGFLKSIKDAVEFRASRFFLVS